jgi:tetratricopeptide (TPR) repeat protein
MTAPALSERDLAVLRSFARRIDAADAGAHNNLGVLYYHKGLVAEAIEEFARALELDPKMQVAQRNLEIAYHSTGYYDSRVAELRERLRQAPDDRDARWELGRAYAALSQVDEAVSEFEQILAQRPDDVATVIQLGLAEKARGRLEAATEWFVRARELDPDSSVVYFYLGEVSYNRGLNDAALAALERAVTLNPENANAHYLMAFVLGDMGRHEEARAASKRAVQLNPPLARAQANLSLERYAAERKSRELRLRERPPPEPEVAPGSELAHHNLGLAFRQKGYYVEALREYRLALERGEDRRLTLQAMAEVHLLKRDCGAALELYETLLREAADSPKLWNEHAVVLHQLGRVADALAGYRRAVDVDRRYALAWNNLGVALTHQGDAEGAIEAFRQALHLRNTFAAARLNLALLLFHLRRFQLALEAYRQVLAETPAVASSAGPAWNGVGLVLVELKRFPDARNAFARAIEADPAYAPAHYNLSFTLSNLGDFDGALRATKRALELDPYYVPQRFALTIDLQYEEATIGVVPEISADVSGEALGSEFNFDQRLLDNIFQELAPAAAAPAPERRPPDDALALARDYVSKGLMELATAEATRAVQRGADRADAATLLGDIYARRGLHGEALERYREARAQDAARPDALLGEVRALLALERAPEAVALTVELLQGAPDDVEVLVAVARVRAATGDAAGALTLLRQAQARAPARADLHKLQGDVARRIGDKKGALAAYRAALELDHGFVQVWLELGRLQEDREEWGAAQEAYEQALDALPTLHEAALALADLLRRTGRARAAVSRLAAMLEEDPYDLDALFLLGRALIDDKRHEPALEAFRRLLKYDREHVGALFHVGVVLARLHRYGDAVESWEHVTRIDPAGPYAQRARLHARTALDLQHIFASDAA